MKINILGSTWTISERSSDEDRHLSDCDGYCDWTTREIVVRREYGDDTGNLNNMEEYVRKVKRHEIVHAFLLECGLAHSSSKSKAWAVNEEMIDWIAHQGTAIYRAWKDAGALSKNEGDEL